MPQTVVLVAFAVGVLVGLIVVLAIRGALGAVRGRGGVFSGTWEQTLTGGRGTMRAQDLVTCRQSGSELRGTIRRVEPSVEDYKEWRFAGHAHGGLASCIYWGADPERLPADFGTLQFALADAGRAEGMMIRRQVSQDGKRFEGEPLQTHLTWTRPSVREGAKRSVAQAAEARKTGQA